MKDNFHSPKNLLGELLRGMLQNMTKEQQVGAQMLRGWEGIVGKALSEKSRVTDLQKDCLHIAVREGGAMQLMLINKRQILYKLGKQYPGLNVKNIHVFLDKEPVVTQRKEQKPIQRHVIEKKDKDNISDKDFKDIMQRIKTYSRQEKQQK